MYDITSLKVWTGTDSTDFNHVCLWNGMSQILYINDSKNANNRISKDPL